MEDCRGLVLGHALLDTSNPKEKVECMFTILQMMPNWGAAVCTCEGRTDTQRDLDRLEKWADGDPIKFNKDKCKVLPLGRPNALHWYRQGRPGWAAALLMRSWGSWLT